MKSISNILLIARREAGLLLADRWTAAAMLAAPLIVGGIMALIYSGRIVRDIPTLVVDEDQSSTSRLLARALDANEFLSVVATRSTTAGMEESLRDGSVQCAVQIPRGAERDLKRGQQVHIVFTVSGTNIVAAVSAIRGASEVAGTLAAGIRMENMERHGVPSMMAFNAAVPVEITHRFVFNPAEEYSTFLLPGLLIALIQQVVMVGTALSWAREYQDGILGGLRSISTSIGEQMTGKLIPYIAVGLLWSVVFFAGVFPLFGIPFTGSVMAASVALAMMTIAMGLLAMTISAAAVDKVTAMQFVFIVSSPAFLVSGFTFPLMAMTAPVRVFAALIPTTHFLAAWRRIVLYGAGFENIGVELGIMAAMIVGFGLSTFLLVRRRSSRVVAPAEGLS